MSELRENITRVGYWTHAEILAMDQAATVRMLKTHPEHCSGQFRERVTAYLKVVRRKAETPTYTPAAASSVLHELFAICTDNDDFVGQEKDGDGLPSSRAYIGTGEAIRRAVAQKHGFTMLEFDARTRRGKVVRARHEAMYLIAQQTTLSYPQIGRLFGFDHTTVLRGIRKHADRNNLPRVREGAGG